MPKYIAIRGKNRGKIYDLTDEGLEEFSLRKNEKGQLTPAGYQGLIVPFAAMKDDLLLLPKKGGQVDSRIYEYFKH